MVKPRVQYTQAQIKRFGSLMGVYSSQLRNRQQFVNDVMNLDTKSKVKDVNRILGKDSKGHNRTKAGGQGQLRLLREYFDYAGWLIVPPIELLDLFDRTTDRFSTLLTNISPFCRIDQILQVMDEYNEEIEINNVIIVDPDITVRKDYIVFWSTGLEIDMDDTIAITLETNLLGRYRNMFENFLDELWHLPNPLNRFQIVLELRVNGLTRTISSPAIFARIGIPAMYREAVMKACEKLNKFSPTNLAETLEEVEKYPLKPKNDEEVETEEFELILTKIFFQMYFKDDNVIQQILGRWRP